jgi:hypothetical protein
MSANYGYSCIALFSVFSFCFFLFFVKAGMKKKINPVNLSGVLHITAGI